MAKSLFNRIAIIGLGLIGSSIARAARERNLAAIIVGCDANEVSLAFAKKHGFADITTSQPAEAVQDSQLIILATPPTALGNIAKAIAPHVEKGAIIMDVCSVKQAAIDAFAPHVPEGVNFIPAHPIAGSEQSGIGAGRGDLFERKQVIVTPAEPTGQALKTITAFWQAMGAHVEGMPASLHDLLYAHVSHLPQLLAFAAAKSLADYKDDKNLQKFLRLSHSNPALWTEIFSMNKDNLGKALDRYLDAVAHIGNELSSAPEGTISEVDNKLAHTTLFPRIAASCLITTVMEAEKLAGFSFGRYAGTGFADFTYPAAIPPEADIERISGQSAAVVAIISQYIAGLKKLRSALDSKDSDRLEKMLQNA